MAKGFRIRWTPALISVVAYLVTGPLTHITVKDLIHEHGFHYEGHLVLLHFLSGALLSWLGYRLGFFGRRSGERKVPALNFRERVKVLKIAFLAVASTLILRVIFRYLSLSIANVLKNLTPLFMYIIAVRRGVDRYDRKVALSVLLVCCGAVTSAGDAHINLFGCFLCLAGVLLGCFRWVKTQELSLVSALPPAALLWYVNSVGAMILVPYCLFVEGAGFAMALSGYGLTVWLLLGFAMAGAAVFEIASYSVVHYTSATTKGILANCVGSAEILVGLFAFSEAIDYSIWGYVGLVVAMFGSFLYVGARKKAPSKRRGSYLRPRDCVALPYQSGCPEPTPRSEEYVIENAIPATAMEGCPEDPDCPEVIRMDKFGEDPDLDFIPRGKQLQRRWTLFSLGYSMVFGYLAATGLVAFGVVDLRHKVLIDKYAPKAVQDGYSKTTQWASDTYDTAYSKTNDGLNWFEDNAYNPASQWVKDAYKTSSDWVADNYNSIMKQLLSHQKQAEEKAHKEAVEGILDPEKGKAKEEAIHEKAMEKIEKATDATELEKSIAKAEEKEMHKKALKNLETPEKALLDEELLHKQKMEAIEKEEKKIDQLEAEGKAVNKNAKQLHEMAQGSADPAPTASTLPEPDATASAAADKKEVM